MTKFMPMITSRLNYLPALIIGLYFFSINFIATHDYSYLILTIGSISLILTQSKINWRILVSREAMIAYGLFISTAIAAELSPNHNTKMVIAQIPGLLVFSIIVLYIQEKKQLAPLIYLSCITLLGATLKFYMLCSDESFSQTKNSVAATCNPLFIAPNDMASMVILLPLLIYFEKTILNQKLPIISIIYTATLLLLAIFLLSRLSLLLIAVTLGYFFYPKNGFSNLKYFCLTIFLLSALIFFADPTLTSKLKHLDFTRINLWRLAWLMFNDSPWVGHGPGSFSQLYYSYLDRLSREMVLGLDTHRNMGWAHSLFFESAAEKGVIGLASVLFYFGYITYAITKKIRSTHDNFAKIIGLTFFLLFITATIELSLLRVWGIYMMYLILGLVAVFCRTSNKLNS
jgi:O-antigen ligase